MKLWGGRFEKKEMDPKVIKFTSSIDIDKVLAGYDCLSTKVHVDMLNKKGFITEKEKKALKKALDECESKIKKGTLSLEGFEDIHSVVQTYVDTKLPEVSKKMHTGRSRNEQIVNDVRLYCKDSIEDMKKLIQKFQKSLVSLADKNSDCIIPGYTHLNRAQPVLFAHLLLAYVEMLERDSERLSDAFKRCDISVMGSGAIAGSALDLDRAFVAKKLGFSKISGNSIDAVSDRDFIAEVIAAVCFVNIHLSRISEDLILYSTAEFNFIDIGADYCTGSSLMPQKKNPDVLELVRGKTAQVISALNSILVLLKGLPHSYNRDLQEDKKPLFESVELVKDELSIMADLIPTIKVKKENTAEALEAESIYATDIAEYLVRKGVAFKDAHDVVGGIVKMCIDAGSEITDLSMPEFKEFSEDIDDDIYDLLNPETSVNNKKTVGSTNSKLVKEEIKNWKKKLRG